MGRERYAMRRAHSLAPKLNRTRIEDNLIRTLDVREGEDCFIVGAIIKQMRLRPDVLKEYAEKRSILPMPDPEDGRTFTSDDDSLILEDESGRIALLNPTIPAHELVTGVVVGVRGTETSDGDFEVTDMMVCDLAPQHPLVPLEKKSPRRLVALVSGLRLGSGEAQMQRRLLLDYLTGFAGTDEDARDAAQVIRVILVGNSVGVPDDAAADGVSNVHVPVRRETQLKVVNGVRQLDRFLVQLGQSCLVDVMPGAEDPAGFTLPQQPLNVCLTPLSRDYEQSVFLRTNPYRFEMEGRQFLGVSGQTLDNLGKYVRCDEPLTLLEWTLRWRHIAPTAPDTLGCYPFHERDPFVLDEAPHIYFVGNQPAYEVRRVKSQVDERRESVLVCVPRFSATSTIVLVDLDTLDCEPLHFDCSF